MDVGAGMNKQDMIDAVSRIMATDSSSDYLIRCVSEMPFSCIDAGSDNNNSAEAIHIRNGGEPWKTKNKRGRR